MAWPCRGGLGEVWGEREREVCSQRRQQREKQKYKGKDQRTGPRD